MNYSGENLVNLGGEMEEQENNELEVLTKVEEAPEEILESYSEIAREGITNIAEKAGEADRIVEIAGYNGSLEAIEKAASENVVKVIQTNGEGDHIVTLVEIIVDKETESFELRKISEPEVVQREENSYNDDEIAQMEENDMKAIKRLQEAIANTPIQVEAS